MLVYTKIKDLRLQNSKTQEELATAIGVSRPTYANIESGKLEINLDQLEKLAKFYSLDLTSLISGVVPDLEKYKEMLLFFLRETKTTDGKIPKTKLAKMLYLADFGWFYEHFKSMSGMQYRKIAYGPVPDAYFRVVDEMVESGKLNIDVKPSDEGRTAFLISEKSTNLNQKLNRLSKAEAIMMKKIATKWADKSTSEIVNFTHNQLPYFLCNDNEIIPYELITQEDTDKVI